MDAVTRKAEHCDFAHLGTIDARIGSAFARPRVVAGACIVVLAVLGWLYLAVMVAGMAVEGRAGDLGPGMALFDLIARPYELDTLGRALFDALCRPVFGSVRTHFGMPASGTWAALDVVLALAMWCAMGLAMMLPTAGPMIFCYAQIADTAACKGERVVSPVLLAAGYVTVWFGFALIATAVQFVCARVALLDPAMASASTLFSGAIFLAAGLYQFSALKHACVTRCQRPFPFFFANWSDRAAGVFRLGLRQGLYCLGCCFAMMLVMFAVGVMNVVWMAALAAIMTTEKLATTTRFSRAVGLAFLLTGMAFIASAVIGHWPVHSG
jgi:predicted metal-binding membrane protein